MCLCTQRNDTRLYSAVVSGIHSCASSYVAACSPCYSACGKPNESTIEYSALDTAVLQANLARIERILTNSVIVGSYRRDEREFSFILLLRRDRASVVKWFALRGKFESSCLKRRWKLEKLIPFLSATVSPAEPKGLRERCVCIYTRDMTNSAISFRQRVFALRYSTNKMISRVWSK